MVWRLWSLSCTREKLERAGVKLCIRQKVDYGKYRYSQKEILKYIGESAALCGAVDYLFYQTPWVMLLVVPVSVFFLKWKKKQMIRERKRRLNYQFRDALNSMSVAVQAGYSVENADFCLCA